MKRLLNRESIGISLVALALVTLLLAWLAPNDVTLKNTSKVVYIHGALVWTAMLTLTAAGAIGLVALAATPLKRDKTLHAWALGLGAHRAGFLDCLLAGQHDGIADGVECRVPGRASLHDGLSCPVHHRDRPSARIPL